MDEDDDDFYGAGIQQVNEDQEMSGQGDAVKQEKADMSDEEEEEDSDDDVQFTLEKPEVTKTETPTTRAVSKAVAVEPSVPQPSKSRAVPVTKQESTEPQPVKHELLHNGKQGKDYPEYRTSDIDLDNDPVWPADGKKITELDIDADLVEHSKPWRLPGTDITDYFNYGFDEYTWTQYCAKQRSMSSTIMDIKEDDNKLKSMLGNMPDMNGGMPDMNQMMQMMMAGMGGGADPSKMDFGQAMSMMGGGMPGMQPGQAQFNPAGNFGGQGGNSPLPQQGQGYQAPMGPGGMEGFNPQMQQEQQSHGGGGGYRGRGRRGRGYH